MKKYSVVGVTLSILFVEVVCTSIGLAQPPRERPKKPPLKAWMKEKQELSTLHFYGGLDRQIGGRIRHEIRSDCGSMLELPVFFGGQFEDLAKLDQNQRPEFQSVFEKRKRQRAETLEETFRLVRETTPFSESGLRLVIAKASKKESEYEDAFAKSMLEILDPIQLDLVCKSAMGALRPEFARHSLVATHLKLTKEQIAKFDRWRMENSNVVKQDADFRKSLQEDGRIPLTEQQSREAKKFFKGITTNFVNYARDADNSLTKEQFQFVARAEGMIRDDETLDEYFDRQTETDQLKLAARLVHFERILEERRKK